jgi:hypothetical protein
MRIDPKRAAMNDASASLPDLSNAIEQRLKLMRDLAESLESSSGALLKNDAEAIARGAAYQAELCWQWSHLENQLRRKARRHPRKATLAAPAPTPDTQHSARLQAEWNTLGARIRYLTRVHWSLLRYLERSLSVLHRVINGCAATYSPPAGLPRPEAQWPAGETKCRV